MPETPKSFEEWWGSVRPFDENTTDGQMAKAAWDAAIASLPPQAAAVPMPETPKSFEEWHSRTVIHSGDKREVQLARYYRKQGWR